MSRQKKTRRLTDIMPARKSDQKPAAPKPRSGRQPTRYELNAKAREEKRKRRHKGLASGSRHSAAEARSDTPNGVVKDPRSGSRKKVPLVVECADKPGQEQPGGPSKTAQKPTALDPMAELERLENNACLNRLLDELEAGKTLRTEDQAFVDECLARITRLMDELGIENDEENDDDLYRTFEKIDINRFR